MVTEVDVYRWLQSAVKLRSRVFDESTIHVSEVVDCLRKSYYMRTRTVQLSPSNMLKLLGEGAHRALQEVLKRSGFEVEFEVGLDLDGFRLVGHVDAIHVRNSVLIELKTVSKIPDAPYSHHVLQTQIYRALTGVRRSYIVYLSRSDGRVRVFRVENGRNVLKWAMERAKLLKSALANGRIPEPERGYLCNYCEFQLNCWGEP